MTSNCDGWVACTRKGGLKYKDRHGKNTPKNLSNPKLKDTAEGLHNLRVTCRRVSNEP